MAQRLALKTKVREGEGDRFIFSSDFREFCKRQEELGIGPRAQIRVTWDEDEQEFFFWVPLPEAARLPDGRRKVVRRPTKKTLAAKAQIAEHKENIKKGVKTKGHIPGVGAKKRKIVRKKKVSK